MKPSSRPGDARPPQLLSHGFRRPSSLLSGVGGGRFLVVRVRAGDATLSDEGDRSDPGETDEEHL